MPESAGASQSVVDPVINPLDFQKQEVSEPSDAFGNNYYQNEMAGNDLTYVQRCEGVETKRHQLCELKINSKEENLLKTVF